MISSPLELIKMLKNTKGLFVTCPGCGDERPINRVDLCTESSLSKRILRYMEERKIQIGESKVELEELKRKPVHLVKTTASVNVGKIIERFFPLLKGFEFAPLDCKTFQDPIDYLVFHGLSKGTVTNIEFGDVKSGQARLSSVQRDVKRVIEAGKISVHLLGGQNA